jgi:hypothetical protein
MVPLASRSLAMAVGAGANPARVWWWRQIRRETGDRGDEAGCSAPPLHPLWVPLPAATQPTVRHLPCSLLQRVARPVTQAAESTKP